MGELNATLPADALSAELDVVAGDEVQGLFRRPSAAVAALARIRDRFHGAPIEGLVFGVGWGALSTGPIPPAPERVRHVGRLDGSCFHAARIALERHGVGPSVVSQSLRAASLDAVLRGERVAERLARPRGDGAGRVGRGGRPRRPRAKEQAV